MAQNAGWTGMFEIVDESAFGVFPSDPVMEYIGVVDKININDKPIISSTRFLPQDAYTDTMGNLKTSAYLHQKTASDITVEVPYNPKNITDGFLIHALGDPSLTAETQATGATDTLGTSFSLAGYALTTPKYFVYTGGYVQDFSLEIPKEDFVKSTATLGFANSGNMSAGYVNTPNLLASDYIGEAPAAHATATAGGVLTFADVTTSTLTPDGGDAADDIVNSITINIKNNIEWVKELGSAFTTGKSAAVLLGRDITLGIELSYNELDIYDEIFAGTTFSYSLTFDSYLFEFDGFKFPEYPIDLNPEELLGETIESNQVTNIKITPPAV